MTPRHLAPLLLLPVAVAAWAGDDLASGDLPGWLLPLVGAGGIPAVLAVYALLQRAGLPLPRLTLSLGGPQGGEATAQTLPPHPDTVTRLRRTVGLAADPDEPAPGVGLVVDVARLSACTADIGDRLGRVEDEVAGLRVAVEQSNRLLSEVLGVRG